MKIIKRILLCMGGSILSSTGLFLLVLPKLLSDGEVTITVAKFIRADLYLAAVLCLVIGGIITIGYAIGGDL